MIRQGTASEARGLLETIGDLAATLVATAHTRLDLLSLDLEEDREHLLILTVTAFLAVFFLGLGVVFGALVLVAFFWETHRLLILAFLACAFLAAGFAAAARVRGLARAKPRLFVSSLAELLKDRQALVSES